MNLPSIPTSLHFFAIIHLSAFPSHHIVCHMITELNAPFIIAEIGSNWARYDNDQKNKECALAHIRAAALCGASAAKFQYFKHRELYGFDAPNRYELPKEWLPALKAESEKANVEFMCSAF